MSELLKSWVEFQEWAGKSNWLLIRERKLEATKHYYYATPAGNLIEVTVRKDTIASMDQWQQV
jgi:hypothetical protein